MSLRAHLPIRRGEFRLTAQLDLPERGITAIFGPSGCGKTSILRAIAGLDRHPGARVEVAGETWQSDQRFLATHERPVGMVFQQPHLFEHLTVRENIDYGIRRIAADQRRVSVDKLVETLGIGALLDRRTNGLSGGEQQRIAIARALAVSPTLMLLDEPLSSLDQARKLEILPYLESLQIELGIPMLYVSHSLDEIARIADRLVLPGDGQILAQGDVGELLTRLDLPLARSADAESLIMATVCGHDGDDHLTELRFSGGTILAPRENLATGSTVRVRIAARDVSITLKRPTETSILNIFHARVEQLSAIGSAQMIVKLRVADDVLLARITRRSQRQLALEPGKAVFVQAKGVALLA